MGCRAPAEAQSYFTSIFLKVHLQFSAASKITGHGVSQLVSNLNSFAFSYRLCETVN